MGKSWDSAKGGRGQWVAWMTDVMRECLRVLKPGGHALIWAIPRTSHWTAMALEDAGFEIRDVVTHLFGSGFPKSLDISKAIDKAAGAEREVLGWKPHTSGIQRNHSLQRNEWDGGNSRQGKLANDQMPITAPATDAAKEWQGFGTALKPACEFWWLCRKPISEKTVAANVLKHGTGGLNIDGCRIEGAGSDWSIPDDAKPRNSIMAYEGKTSPNSDCMIKNRAGAAGSPIGRFPANLVLTCCGNEPHDEDCAVRLLDEQSGVSKSAVRNGGKGGSGLYEGGFGDGAVGGFTDSGGASRFFYCAKASKSDRGPNNKHPTVKSTKLMDYLIRLVTPPGGVVLDPFAGSGSTGVAAKAGNFDFLGIERDPEYFGMARERLGT